MERYVSIRTQGKKAARGSNKRESSADQKRRNDREARKKLTRLIACNFGKKDLYLTLTYLDTPTPEDAEKHLTRYIRKVRCWRKKNGMSDLKYIAVTEYRYGTRVHHHILIPSMPADVAMELWNAEAGHGRVDCQWMYEEGGFEALARYLIKEGKAKSARRWRQSKNLAKPKITIKEVRPAAISHKIPVPHGWIADKVAEEVDTGFYHYVRYLRVAKSEKEEKRCRD